MRIIGDIFECLRIALLKLLDIRKRDYGRLIEDMRLLNDILKKEGFDRKYWLFGSALLGYFRSGAPLENDYDLDFAVYREDLPALEECLISLQKAGFQKRFKWVSSNGETEEYTLVKNGAKFEFFIFDKAKDSSTVRWKGFVLRRRIQFTYEIEMPSLKSVSIAGRDWLIPDDLETFLPKIYGPNWRSPDPNYDYANPSCVPSNIRTEAWTGSWRWQ